MINSFTKEYRFLSNFWPAEVQMYGVTYPTVEHAYQASKTTNPKLRETIRACATPAEAKRKGKQLIIRQDWFTFRLQAMETLLRRKFSIPELKEKLLSTGEEDLVEGNNWGDTFWGVCLNQGENNLGKLLMKIRQELQEETECPN